MRAAHRVLRPGAVHCFYVITSGRDLTEADRKRMAERDGNEHVESKVRYDVMMEEAGYTDVEITDKTAQYLETIQGWKSAWEEDADAFIELVGEEDFRRRLRNRDLDRGFVEDGLVARYRVSGIRPA